MKSTGENALLTIYILTHGLLVLEQVYRGDSDCDATVLGSAFRLVLYGTHTLPVVSFGIIKVMAKQHVKSVRHECVYLWLLDPDNE